MTPADELIQARISAILQIAPDWEPSQLDVENAGAIAEMILDPATETISMQVTHEIFRSLCPEDHPQNVTLIQLPETALYFERVALRAMLLRARQLISEDHRYQQLLNAHATFALQVAITFMLFDEVLPSGADMMTVQANTARTALTHSYNAAVENYGQQHALRLMDMVRRDALNLATIPPVEEGNVRTLH